MLENERTLSFGEQVIKLGEELALLEEKLLTPNRTTEDLIRHIQLVAKLRRLTVQ